ARFRAAPALLLQAEGHAQLSVREGTHFAAFPRRACLATLSEWGGTLHRLQALRGNLPGPGDHDRGRTPPERRYSPHDALRHRHGEVHLLRALSGSLSG